MQYAYNIASNSNDPASANPEEKYSMLNFSYLRSSNPLVKGECI